MHFQLSARRHSTKGEKREGRIKRREFGKEGVGIVEVKQGGSYPLRASYGFEKVNPSTPQIWRAERNKITNRIKKASRQVVGKKRRTGYEKRVKTEV